MVKLLILIGLLALQGCISLALVLAYDIYEATTAGIGKVVKYSTPMTYEDDREGEPPEDDLLTESQIDALTKKALKKDAKQWCRKEHKDRKARKECYVNPVKQQAAAFATSIGETALGVRATMTWPDKERELLRSIADQRRIRPPATSIPFRLLTGLALRPLSPTQIV